MVGKAICLEPLRAVSSAINETEMSILINDVVKSGGFGDYRIGQIVNADIIKENTVGLPADGYQSYGVTWNNIVVEVMTHEDKVHSYDIIMKHQDDVISIRRRDGDIFNLNKCRIDELIGFLNESEIEWGFRPFLRNTLGKTIVIELRMDLSVSLIFDFDSGYEQRGALEVINIMPYNEKPSVI